MLTKAISSSSLENKYMQKVIEYTRIHVHMYMHIHKLVIPKQFTVEVLDLFKIAESGAGGPAKSPVLASHQNLPLPLVSLLVIWEPNGGAGSPGKSPVLSPTWEPDGVAGFGVPGNHQSLSPIIISSGLRSCNFGAGVPGIPGNRQSLPRIIISCLSCCSLGTKWWCRGPCIISSGLPSCSLEPWWC